VDDNNVLLGYDLSQRCCENADWFVHDAPIGYIPEKLNQPEVLEGYVFEKTCIRPDHSNVSDSYQYSVFDSGDIIAFKVVNETEGVFKYIHIFNSHNGYYSHGFEYKDGGDIIEEGRI